MLTAFRLFKTKYANSWSDGEGAFRFGGRWNTPGTRVLYASDSLSLATLEILVHINDDSILNSFSFATLTFDESLVMNVEEEYELPKNWKDSPLSVRTQEIGAEWYYSSKSAVLRVPTALIPVGFNYVVNLAHADLDKIEYSDPRNFDLDSRLE